MSRSSILSTVLLLLATARAPAQVPHGGAPAAGLLPELQAYVSIEPPNDLGKLRAEDDGQTHGALRYGVPVPLALNLQEHGQWDTAPGGTLVWRVAIVAPGSQSVGVELDDFSMPVGSRLFAYDPGLADVLGSFDRRNERGSGELTLAPVPGDTLVLELQIQAQGSIPPRLSVGRVIYDYRGLFSLTVPGLPTSQSPSAGGAQGAFASNCWIHASCIPGADKALHRRATVRTLSGGVLCSGVLLNNTEEDGEVYVLSANHCGTTSQVVALFNHESRSCGGGPAPTGDSISGATILAADIDSDGLLMHFDVDLPPSYNATFMGWNRWDASLGPETLDRGSCFSHPGGAPKQFAEDSDGAPIVWIQFSPNGGDLATIPAWDLVFDTGGIAPGSSGGGLADSHNHVRGFGSQGSLTSLCTGARFGLFSALWNNTNIAAYLDPAGSGATQIDAYDPGWTASPPPVPTTLQTLYVDPVAGVDCSPGCGAAPTGTPLRTISYALAIAPPGATVHLAAGTYSMAFESLPILIRQSVKLVGPELGRALLRDGISPEESPTLCHLGGSLTLRDLHIVRTSGISAPCVADYIPTTPLASGPLEPYGPLTLERVTLEGPTALRLEGADSNPNVNQVPSLTLRESRLAFSFQYGLVVSLPEAAGPEPVEVLIENCRIGPSDDPPPPNVITRSCLRVEGGPGTGPLRMDVRSTVIDGREEPVAHGVRLIENLSGSKVSLEHCTLLKLGFDPQAPKNTAILSPVSNGCEVRVLNTLFHDNAADWKTFQASHPLHDLQRCSVSDPALDGIGGSVMTTTPTPFVKANAGDVHLLPGASAIDLGQTTTSPSCDFDLDPRIDCASGGPDAGADEFVDDFLYLTDAVRVGETAKCRLVSSRIGNDFVVLAWIPGAGAGSEVCAPSLPGSLLAVSAPSPILGTGVGVAPLLFAPDPAWVGLTFGLAGVLFDPVTGPRPTRNTRAVTVMP